MSKERKTYMANRQRNLGINIRVTPEEKKKIADEKKKIIEAIVEIQVGMMEEFAAEYPMSASNARSRP